MARTDQGAAGTAIDGLVMRYQEASSTSVGLPLLLLGVVEVEGDCLYLVQNPVGRFPILWPAGTRWDGPNQSVVSPVGGVMRIGSAVEGRGAFFYLTDVHRLAGSAASNLAASCLDTFGQVAVVENTGTAIGPKDN